MTTQFQKINIEPLDAGDAFTESLNSRTDLGVLYRRNEFEQITANTPTSNLVRLKDEQGKLAAKLSELATKQAAECELVREWNRRVDQLQQARERLEVGYRQFQKFQGAVESRMAFIDEQAWGHTDIVEVPAGRIVELYGFVSATEKAIQDFPRWERLRREDIAKIESDLEAFRVLHKITPGK